MSLSVKTQWAIELEASSKPGNTYVPSPFSTLNGFFNIEENTLLNQDEFPVPRILVIGNRGHENDGVVHTTRKRHRSRDAVCFQHIPFAARPVNNDFTDEEREDLRLRRLENHDGEDWFMYYGLVLPDVPSARETVIIDTSTRPYTETPVTYSADQYNPVPVASTAGQTNQAPDKLIRVRDYLKMKITIAQMQRIVEACEIKFGTSREAIISEFAVASSFDKTVNSTEGGVSATYTEAIGSQILSFLSSDRIELEYTNKEIDTNISVGNAIPLFE